MAGLRGPDVGARENDRRKLGCRAERAGAGESSAQLARMGVLGLVAVVLLMRVTRFAQVGERVGVRRRTCARQG